MAVINRGVIKVKQKDNSFIEFYPHAYSEDVKYKETSVYAAIEALETANKNATDNYNKANGLVQLDENALIPSTLIPAEFKEVKVVDDITARDALTDPYVGLSVFVKDASADETVNAGGAYYIYDGAAWVKTAEAESMDVVLNWSAIQGKPTTLDGYGITDGVNVSEVVETATAGKILKLNSDAKLPADVVGNADTASKLKSAVLIGVTGDDVDDASVSFDGSGDVNVNVVLSATGVVADTYTKVTVDAKGRVTAGASLVASDIPELDWAKITTGKPTTVDGYGITDALKKTGDTMTGALTLAADPTEDLHAATKSYVDSVVQGLDVKASVRVASTENVDLAAATVVDGVTLAEGNRVLVKNQTNKAENGVYVKTTSGLVRAEDFDGDKVSSGAFTFVEEGTVNANNGFVLVTDGAITVGTTELEFNQFSGAGQVIVGAGLAKNGNEIYLADTGVTAGTYTKVTVDAKGRVTAAEQLASSDLPEIAWAVITGKPSSAVADIDDAVAKRHEHANKAQLDKVGETDGVMTYDSKKMATQEFVQGMVVISESEPADLPAGGIWFGTVTTA